MSITPVDIARVAAAHYGVPTTEILSIMKTPTNPATLRDEFAGKAMQGIVADPDLCMGVDKVAEWAYTQADAMLKARES